MLTPGHIILSIPISFDWIVVCAAVQTSTQPPYITHQGCASHQHWLLFNSIFNHLLLLQHHTLADRCYSTVLQHLQQLLSLSRVIIKANHYFLSDYTALIHCKSLDILVLYFYHIPDIDPWERKIKAHDCLLAVVWIIYSFDFFQEYFQIVGEPWCTVSFFNILYAPIRIWASLSHYKWPARAQVFIKINLKRTFFAVSFFFFL